MVTSASFCFRFSAWLTPKLKPAVQVLTASSVLGRQGKERGVSSYLTDLAKMEHDTTDGLSKHKLTVDDVHLEVFQQCGHHATHRGSGCWHGLPLCVC